MSDLVFKDADVHTLGVGFTSSGRTMPEGWYTSCDLGSEGLNAVLAGTRHVVTDGLLGAAAEVYSLGQAALDAVTTYQRTDASV